MPVGAASQSATAPSCTRAAAIASPIVAPSGSSSSQVSTPRSVSQTMRQRLLMRCSRARQAGADCSGGCTLGTRDEGAHQLRGGLLEQRLEQHRFECVGELEAQREIDAAAVARYRREAPIALEHTKRAL